MSSTASRLLPRYAPALIISSAAASLSPSKFGQSLLTGTVSTYFELVNKLKRQAMQPRIAAAPRMLRIAAAPQALRIEAAPQVSRNAACRMGAELDAKTALAAAVPLPAESNRKVRFADPMLIPPSTRFFTPPFSVESPGTDEPTQFLPELKPSREAPSYLQALRAAASRFSCAVAGALVGVWGTTTAAAGQFTTDVASTIGVVVMSVAVLFARAQNVATRTFGAQRSDFKKA